MKGLVVSRLGGGGEGSAGTYSSAIQLIMANEVIYFYLLIYEPKHL